MNLKHFKKKAFTLIELIIVIVLIGILAGMSLPKFIGVQRNAKVAAMVRDIDTLEKAIKMYENDNDLLPIYDVGIDGSNLTDPTKDMEDIYLSLKEALSLQEDSEEYLYKINIGESSKYHTKTKYGHGKTESDYYVYSTKTDRVYYYGYLINDKKEYQHNEVPISFNNNTNNDKVTKLKSKPLLLGKGVGGIKDEGKDIIYDDTVPEVIQNPIWSNSYNDPKAHDKDFNSDLNTNSSDPNLTVTWIGDLTNRKINIHLSIGRLYIKDKDDKNLSFIGEDGKVINNISASSGTKTSFIMPQNAKYIYIESNYDYGFRLYDLSETDNLKLPNEVKNVKYTTSETSINFSWDKSIDSDYSKTLIYRDGVYDGETTSTSFTSKGLQEDKEYTYTLYHQNKTGNISNKTIVKAKTSTNGIVWSNSFNDPKGHDKDLSSFINTTSSNPNITVNWTGDLTGKKINLKLDKATLYIKDKDGNNLYFTDGDGKELNKIHVPLSKTTSFIIPEDAEYIYIESYYSYGFRLYELSD